MEFIIEGIVSEIIIDKSDNFSFKISGTEGFVLRQEEKKYNLLCPDLRELKSNYESHLPCIIISQDYQYKVSEKNKAILIQHGSSCKKIRAKIDIDENGKLKKTLSDKNNPLTISSLVIKMD